LAPDFVKLKQEMDQGKNDNADLLLMNEIASVVLKDDRDFIWAWWNRMPADEKLKLAEEFPECSLVPCDPDEEKPEGKSKRGLWLPNGSQ
jgi:hypothetical protein